MPRFWSRSRNTSALMPITLNEPDTLVAPVSHKTPIPGPPPTSPVTPLPNIATADVSSPPVTKPVPRLKLPEGVSLRYSTQSVSRPRNRSQPKKDTPQ